MKRLGFLFLITFLTNIIFGQDINSLGVDNNPLLNIHESEFLKNQLELESFDFSDKNVAYYFSLVGVQTKMEFFSDAKKHLSSGNSLSLQLVMLDSNEKIETGGFDVIIVAWSKKQVTPKMKEKMIEKLKEAST
ncbi:MAG: hypothetical protein EOM83_16130 [Clostridia bacterium]|nr:hypothetical protein [Clostridia bacterium]